MIGRVNTTVGDVVASSQDIPARPIERHRGDIVRVIVGVIGVAATTVLARQEELSALERNSFLLGNLGFSGVQEYPFNR